MTVKGKRTGGWLPMAEEQKRSFASGVLVDESIPEAEVRNAVSGIDEPDAFVSFIATRVGLYRSQLGAEPQVADELAWAETTMDFAQETRVRLAHFPPNISSAADASHWARYNEELRAAIDRLNTDLAKVETTLLLAMRAVEPQGGRTGRKHRWQRDSLLTSVADWLENSGIQSDEAARISRKVLVALSIEAPDRAAAVIAAVRKSRQRIGD